ncbi:auxin-responsive protein SAUR71-like [Rutidosis leptorrhynchoides]|uniref:auxin-responsive protein SAUR71-like n=1 Tax=Rutidosis leptorrhynchoides TaxID=125765 RepID=UPI003A9A41E5
MKKYFGKRSDSRKSQSIRATNPCSFVPEGYLPVSVGEENEQFVVSLELFKHPIFVNLLKQSAEEEEEEEDYKQHGPVRVHCNADAFERFVEAVGAGKEYLMCSDLIRDV